MSGEQNVQAKTKFTLSRRLGPFLGEHCLYQSLGFLGPSIAQGWCLRQDFIEFSKEVKIGMGLKYCSLAPFLGSAIASGAHGVTVLMGRTQTCHSARCKMRVSVLITAIS